MSIQLSSVSAEHWSASRKYVPSAVRTRLGTSTPIAQWFRPIRSIERAPETLAEDSSYTEADLARTSIGDGMLAADHVCYWGYCVYASDVDLPGHLDGVIDVDAKTANRTFDLGMSEQELDCSEVARAAIDQHGFRASQ